MYSSNNIPSGYNTKTRTNNYKTTSQPRTRGGCSSCQKAREAYLQRVNMRKNNRLS